MKTKNRAQTDSRQGQFSGNFFDSEHLQKSKKTLHKRHSDNSDLARAIALSLQDPDNSDDNDISRRNSETPVGLRNIGNVCFFNSLIQGIFQIEEFRQKILNVYNPKDFEKSFAQIKMQNEDERKRKKASFDLVVAMQHLFVRMMHDTKKVLNPSEVTKSIVDSQGNPLVTGIELDIGEFLINFIERVEEGVSVSNQIAAKDKLPRIDDGFNKLFFGKYKESTHFPQLSKEINESQELSLGPITLSIEQKDVLSSLRTYTKYPITKIDLQGQTVEGTKYIQFTELPKILTFQLQRVQYDNNIGSLVKLADRFDIPKKICLDPFLKQNLQTKEFENKPLTLSSTGISNSNERITLSGKQKSVYKLHSVVIHEGGVDDGHYYTLIYYPEKQSWLKLNDSQVSHITEKQGFQLAEGKLIRAGKNLFIQNEGGNKLTERVDHSPCAYCLFYVKDEFGYPESDSQEEGAKEIYINSQSIYLNVQPTLSVNSDYVEKIKEAYTSNMKKVISDAEKWGKLFLEETSFSLFSLFIPSFYSFLVSQSPNNKEIGKMNILEITLMDKGYSFSALNKSNSKSINQKVLVQFMANLSPELRLREVDINEENQKLLISKKREYKDIRQSLNILNEALVQSCEKNWEKAIELIFSIEEKLFKYEENRYIQEISSFCTKVLSVLFLNLCEIVHSCWTKSMFTQVKSLIQA